jgi:hypothetical protein
MWFRRRQANSASETPSETEPLGQLRLISAELDRQLANHSTRQANALTRISVVFAAAAVTAFAQFTDLLGWSLVPAFFSLTSAFLCIAGMGYWKSFAMNYTPELLVPYLSASEYRLLDRQVKDKFHELAAARKDLDRKTNLLQGAISMLAAAWVSAALIRFVIDPILTGTPYT